jgi:hypothetical protein
MCGNRRKESTVTNITLGLLTRYVCHHFDLNRIIRDVNALSACFTIWLAVNGDLADADQAPGGVDDGEQTTIDPRKGELGRWKKWPVFAGLV